MKKRSVLAIMTALLTVFVFVAAPSQTAYASGYSVDKAVSYAKTWAKKYNDKQFKRINDDCTNFVSQCIKAGGKNFVKPRALSISINSWLKGYAYTSDSSRWYNTKYTYKCGFMKKGVFCYSSSFTFVDPFYQFWKRQRCCSTYGTYSSCAKNSALQKKLKKGDIVQLYDKSEGWHHSMIITSGSRGNWNYCAHTRPAKDAPLRNLQKKNRAFRVIRINY